MIRQLASCWTRFFIAAIIALFLVTFVYRLIRSLFSDVTYAENCLRTWQHRLRRPITSLYTANHVPGFYVTILFEPSPERQSTLERLRFVQEFMANTLPRKKFEILLLASARAQIPPLPQLREQFPSVSFVHAVCRPAPVHTWAIAALKARGAFLVHSDSLKEEIAKLPESANAIYLSFIDPEPTLPYFGGLDALVLVAAAKKAALALLANVHVVEFGLAEEYRLIAERKGLEINVERRKSARWEHAAAYWIANKVAAIGVRWLYARNFWSCREL
jgi:hypothetical protein